MSNPEIPMDMAVTSGKSRDSATGCDAKRIRNLGRPSAAQLRTGRSGYPVLEIINVDRHGHGAGFRLLPVSRASKLRAFQVPM